MLAGPERELVRSAVNAVADSLRTHPADDDVAWGVALFDNLERNQQVALLAHVAHALFDPHIPPPPFLDGPGDGLALTIIGVVIAFIGSVMTSGAILAAVEAIYTRNDLDLLLSSPISPWRVLVVRTSAIAVGALPLYAGMLGPPLLWMAVFSSPLWLSALGVLASLAFAATAVMIAEAQMPSASRTSGAPRLMMTGVSSATFSTRPRAVSMSPAPMVASISISVFSSLLKTSFLPHRIFAALVILSIRISAVTPGIGSSRAG